MESRRATDQDLFKKIVVVLAVPVLTALSFGIMFYGASSQWQKNMEAQMEAHQLQANNRVMELSHRMERLEEEIRISHKQMIDYMINHAEQDRREFYNLRKGDHK